MILMIMIMNNDSKWNNEMKVIIIVMNNKW